MLVMVEEKKGKGKKEWVNHTQKNLTEQNVFFGNLVVSLNSYIISEKQMLPKKDAQIPKYYFHILSSSIFRSNSVK